MEKKKHDRFLTLAECTQKIPLPIVDSIHARFKDSVESIHQKLKSFLDLSQGDISLFLFDSIIGGIKSSWDQTSWAGKDFEEALSFVEASYNIESLKLASLPH